MSSLEEGLGPPLLIIALGIFIIPVIARRVGIPTAAAEVLFGVLLGMVGRYLLEDRLGLEFSLGAGLEFMALLGLLILLFLAGLELDFDRLEEAGPRPLMLGLSGYLLTLALIATGAGWFFADEPRVDFLFLALLLSATSIGIVVPVVKEAGISRRSLGQDLIITGAVAEFVAIMGLATYALFLREGSGSTLGYLQLGFLPLLVLLFWLVYRMANELMWRYPRAISTLFSGNDAPETGMRTSLALMLLFAGLAAALRQEALLGAFLAGLLLSLLFRRAELLEQKLTAFGYGFFIPIFFIWTGFQFDLADAGFDIGDDPGATDVHLFSLELVAYEEYLEEGAVAVQLGNAFNDNGHRLSDTAYLLMEPQARWKLMDQGNEYHLVVSEGQVKVSMVEEPVPELDYRLVAIPLALVLLLLMLGSKMAAGGLLALDHGPREALAGGALIGANLAVAVAGVEIGIEVEALPESLRSPVILTALLSTLIGPLVFGWLNPALPGEKDPRADNKTDTKANNKANHEANNKADNMTSNKATSEQL